VARRAAYAWQSSADGATTWASLSLTTDARTTVVGLRVVVTCSFRDPARTRTGEGASGQTLAVLVK
jgi:hypothetical protein